MIKKTALNPRLAEVGKIKIGGKGEERTSGNGKKFQLPVKYDHFVVTTTEKDPKTGNFIINTELMKKLGDSPQEIKIRLMFDDINLNFHTEFQMYSGNKRICHGDGETATRNFQTAGKQKIPTEDGEKEITVKAGDSVCIKCDPSTCPFAQPDDKGSTKCKPSGILSCMIAESMDIGGVYRFRTHSWNSVSAITAAHDWVSAQTNGIMMGLPLKLKLVKKTTADHGTIQYVTLIVDGELMKVRQDALAEMQNRNMLGIEMRKLEQQAISVGFLNDTDLPEDIQSEFYSEEIPDGDIPSSPEKTDF